MSLVDEFIVQEISRDRYSRVGELRSNVAQISIPCHGVGLRNKMDLKTYQKIRMDYATEYSGFCIVNSANIDDTLMALFKRIRNQKSKLSPTAEDEQDNMFVDKTIIAVEPATQFTYYYDKEMIDKIMSSMESPTFLRYFVRSLKKKAIEMVNTKSDKYQQWKTDFFEKAWLNLISDSKQYKEFIIENYNSQKLANASILIPPTPPLISNSMFNVAIKIIEDTTRLARNSTAIYFNLPFSILKEADLRKRILDYCVNAINPIIILKIRDLDNLLDPDKVNEREAFSEIQETLCDIRKNTQHRCTILLEGGKLTIPGIIKGFDIVTNHLSGNNEKKGGRRKKTSTDPIGFSRYFIKDMLVFYPYKKMIEYSENQLQRTNNEHGLICELLCCRNVKSVKDINRGFWNNDVTRPHFVLTMNDLVTEIIELISTNQIQNAKEIILKSELCVLKRLIPDV